MRRLQINDNEKVAVYKTNGQLVFETSSQEAYDAFYSAICLLDKVNVMTDSKFITNYTQFIIK